MPSSSTFRSDSNEIDQKIICLSPTEMDQDSLDGSSFALFTSLDSSIASSSAEASSSRLGQDEREAVRDLGRRSSGSTGPPVRRASTGRKTIAEKREVSVPRITMTPPHTPVHTFFDLVDHPPTSIASSPDQPAPPSSPASSSSPSSPESNYTVRTPASSWSSPESSSPRPSTKESVWASIAALLGNAEYEEMQRSSSAVNISRELDSERRRGAPSPSSASFEVRSRQGSKSSATVPPKITISTAGIDREIQARTESWPVLEVEPGVGSIRNVDESIGLGIGMNSTGETNWSDWPAVQTQSASSISSSCPIAPRAEDTQPAPRADKVNNTTNGPPSPSPIARSPTMPNLATAHYYYGSAPTTPSPLGRFCTVATAAGDMLEKVPDGRFPFPSPPPSQSSLPMPVSPVAKRRKSAGGDMRMSTLVTTRYAGLSPMTPVISEDKSNANAYTMASNRKEGMGGFHLLPLSKQTPSRRSRGGPRSPLWILLLPLIVIVLHLYLSHVDKQFMDRGRSLVFGVPLRDGLAKLPDWLLKDVREEVFGQREGSKHGIFLLHQGNEDELDHEDDEEALEAAWQSWSSDSVTSAESASSSSAEAATKIFAWSDEFRVGGKVALDDVVGQVDAPPRENVSL